MCVCVCVCACMRVRAMQDVHQMGGDILVDAHGAVIRAYYSTHSFDRPSVDQLLADFTARDGLHQERSSPASCTRSGDSESA
ncbi:hypothetical protein EON67_01130 [archaeon]|nr:MAG: hypothetical protein EON67_01130 [archaeon]